MQIVVICDNGHGHTEKLADAVAEGARSVGARSCHIGAPTCNAGIGATRKAFTQASTRPARVRQSR